MILGLDVTFSRQTLIAPGLAMFLLVLMCYIAGRVHQFFKQTVEREHAFRDGYNTATKSLFSLAARTARGVLPAPAPTEEPNPKTKPMRGYASVPMERRSPVPARHRSPGRRKKNLADTEKMQWPGMDQAA